MTATIDDVAKKKPAEQSAEQQAAVELVRMAKEQGLSLTGSDGLLKQLTKSVIETALDEEMTDHLGYAKHDQAGIGAKNIRNGTRSKTVLPANTGPVTMRLRVARRERDGRAHVGRIGIHRRRIRLGTGHDRRRRPANRATPDDHSRRHNLRCHQPKRPSGDEVGLAQYFVHLCKSAPGSHGSVVVDTWDAK